MESGNFGISSLIINNVADTQEMYSGSYADNVKARFDKIKEHLSDKGNHICSTCGLEKSAGCAPCSRCGATDCA